MNDAQKEAADKKAAVDQRNTKVDLSKGKSYKARTNVSFGQERPTVMAGEIFKLDDPDLAKTLLASNSITEDLEFVESLNMSGGTNAGLTSKELKTAPPIVSKAADEEEDADKNKSKAAGK